MEETFNVVLSPMVILCVFPAYKVSEPLDSIEPPSLSAKFTSPTEESEFPITSLLVFKVLPLGFIVIRLLPILDSVSSPYL